jgi:hypothetical protein
MEGKKIVDLGPVEEVREVTSIECPNCHEGLRGEVEL